MRTHWAAVVEATLHAPIATDSEQYRRDDDTRRTPLNVVRHAGTPTPDHAAMGRVGALVLLHVGTPD